MTYKNKVVMFPCGIESRTGGQYGPVFDDKTFVYIPSPEVPPEFLEDWRREREERSLTNDSVYGVLTYRGLSPRLFSSHPFERMPQGPTLADFLVDKAYTVEIGGKTYSAPLADWSMHLDPCFDFKLGGVYTYGEGSPKKAKTLSTVREGDLIVFYASLSPPVQQDPPKKYVIGYFDVEAVHNCRPELGGHPTPASELPEEIRNNIHVERVDLTYDMPNMRTIHDNAEATISEKVDFFEKLLNADDTFSDVIAVGNHDRSKLLSHAIPLTDANFEIYPELVDFLPWDFPTNRLIRGTRIFDRDGQYEKWQDVLENRGPQELYEHGTQ